MSNNPIFRNPSTRRSLWCGAATLTFICGTTLASSENTALLLRSDLVPDGTINWLDLNAFLNAYNQMDAKADVNGDGVMDPRDMNEFLAVMGKSLATRSEQPPPLSVAAAPPANGSGSKPQGSAPPAAGQHRVPPPTGALDVSFTNGSLSFRQGDHEILRQNGSLWRKSTSASVDASVSVVEQDNGFDLVFRLDNTGRRAKKLGSVVLDGFQLGQAIKVRDFRASGVEIALDDPAAEPMRRGLSYPSEWYSPTMVVQSEIYTLGVSLQYPILDYKHEARLSVKPSSVPGAQRIELELNDDEGPVGYSRIGEIQAREQRQYVVSVRVLPSTDERWIDVLSPYREYFTEMYGGTEYDRDPRPVHATVMASAQSQDTTNRDGFLFPDLRPDVHGFGPWMDELEARADLGWERFMLWRATGLPSNSRGNNAGCGKFEFASPLAQPGPMQDAMSEFPRFDTRGRNLGMWWGDPLRTENSRRVDDFDPSNASDVQEALLEATTAAQAGAETIGLERFNTLPAWESYAWLNELRASTPGVTYITEPACGDLLHTLAGAFLIAQPDPSAPSAGVNSRFYLADFLLPGHETWGLIRVDRMGGPTDDGIREEIMRLADFGFVPVVVPPVEVDRRIVAEETWRDPEW
jgi:hypothetical protein